MPLLLPAIWHRRKRFIGKAWRRPPAIVPLYCTILAVVALRMSDHKKAEQWLRQAEKGRPLIESIYLLGEICKSDGRGEEAATYYAHILKTVPNHFGGGSLLGDIKDQRGDKKGARECYRIAAEVNPADIATSLKYSNALWDVDPDAAVKDHRGLADAGRNCSARTR